MPKSVSNCAPNRRRSPRLVAIALAMLVGAGAAIVPATTAIAAGPSVNRLAGTNRYETAVEISKSSFPGQASVVYIATGRDYPDALAAAPAAALQGGPLLLTEPDALPAVVRSEIARLKPRIIVVVGASSVVSNGIFQQLQSLAPKAIRLGGGDRFETARKIIDYAFDSATTAYIATGTNFPDALSASGAAGAIGAPVVLVQGTKARVDGPTMQLLKKLGVGKAIVVGGPSVVSQGIQVSLRDFAVSRLSGDDRYETSQKINRAAAVRADHAFFATGSAFPDALAGAAVAGAKSAPLYVTPPNCVSAQVKADNDGARITLIGGPSVLGAGVEKMNSCPGTVAVEPTVPAPAPPLAAAPDADSAPAVAAPAVAAPVEGPTPPAVEVTPPPSVPVASVPGRRNTGVPASTALTIHDGDVVVTHAGTVVDGFDIHGTVVVKAADVVIQNSIIRGRTGSKAVALIDAASPLTKNLLIKDSELSPSKPSNNMNGIYGFGFTALRLNVHDVVDAVHIYGDNVRVESSWLHNNFHGPDSRHSDGYTHDDSIQIQKGTNIRVINNSITGAYNAAVMITQDQGPVSNFRFEGNFADGGGCTINIAQKSFGPLVGLSIVDNTFGRTTRVSNCGVIAPTTTLIDMRGNYFTTGEQVAVRKG